MINALSSWGNVPDVEIKRRIFSLIQKEVINVEDLYKFVEKIKNSLDVKRINKRVKINPNSLKIIDSL